MDLSNHAYALDVSGFTILPQQVNTEALCELRSSADAALAAARTVRCRGGKLKHTGGSAYYESSRCMYCWGDACFQLLDNATLHELCALVFGNYQLWDMSILSALPVPEHASAATTSWHRDFGSAERGLEAPNYLWFFVCLDDTSVLNGATWVVPGSHRLNSRHQPAELKTWTSDNLEIYPSRVPLCAKAGDILVLDPTVLHTSGRNSTSQPRRLLNVGICRDSMRPLLNHWVVAGPSLQDRANERVKKMLGAGFQPLETTWSVLPEGWETQTRNYQENMR
jgi:hypothetical protein